MQTLNQKATVAIAGQGNVLGHTVTNKPMATIMCLRW